jgi:hypothetical protein
MMAEPRELIVTGGQRRRYRNADNMVVAAGIN